MLKSVNLRLYVCSALAGALVLGGMGCSELPGTPGQQGAAIGGASGAAVGAAAGGERHWLLGALLGGALGAGGGYLIGANSDRLTRHDRGAAEEASRRAQTTPATAQQARAATTADVNGDGFVTMDEVVAMQQAGVPDQEMIDRLRATGQVFDLTPEQQNYLRDRGVSQRVVNEMPQINRQLRDQLVGQQPSPGIISRPPGQ